MLPFTITEEESKRLAAERDQIARRLHDENEAAHKATIKLLSRLGRRAMVIVDAFMRRHHLDTGGCRTFYAPSEWKARREQHGTESLLVIVYDGGDLHSIMNHEFGFELSGEIEKLLENEGLYIEACTNWYSAVYER